MATKKKVKTFEEVSALSNDISPEREGCRVFSENGKEFGYSLGVYGTYNGEAGTSSRIKVIWGDNQITRCVTAGILFKNGAWKIC